MTDKRINPLSAGPLCSIKVDTVCTQLPSEIHVLPEDGNIRNIRNIMILKQTLDNVRKNNNHMQYVVPSSEAFFKFRFRFVTSVSEYLTELQGADFFLSS
jgi:hypothetical protein